MTRKVRAKEKERKVKGKIVKKRLKEVKVKARKRKAEKRHRTVGSSRPEPVSMEKTARFRHSSNSIITYNGWHTPRKEWNDNGWQSPKGKGKKGKSGKSTPGRKGKGNDGKKGKSRGETPPRKAPCKRYMKGTCAYTKETCQYGDHPPDCYQFAAGTCQYGKDCRFRHLKAKGDAHAASETESPSKEKPMTKKEKKAKAEAKGKKRRRCKRPRCGAAQAFMMTTLSCAGKGLGIEISTRIDFIQQHGQFGLPKSEGNTSLLAEDLGGDIPPIQSKFPTETEALIEKDDTRKILNFKDADLDGYYAYAAEDAELPQVMQSTHSAVEPEPINMGRIAGSDI